MPAQNIRPDVEEVGYLDIRKEQSLIPALHGSELQVRRHRGFPVASTSYHNAVLEDVSIPRLSRLDYLSALLATTTLRMTNAAGASLGAVSAI